MTVIDERVWLEGTILKGLAGSRVSEVHLGGDELRLAGLTPAGESVFVRFMGISRAAINLKEHGDEERLRVNVNEAGLYFWQRPKPVSERPIRRFRIQLRADRFDISVVCGGVQVGPLSNEP